MKSSKEELKKRGYIEDDDITNDYKLLTLDELCVLLESKKAFERTIAIRLLENCNNILQLDLGIILLETLVKEKSLYTKIEICNALEKGDSEIAKQMLSYVGKIGKNQHVKLPNEVSEKISYPLPRDIIARVMGKMNKSVLPILVEALNDYDVFAIREVIDGIGFLCFYNDIPNECFVVKKLIKCYEEYKDDYILRWKITMAFSAFNNEFATSELKKIIRNDNEELIIKEAYRALKLIEKRCK
ncbi:hypothetical protein LL033_05030 [Clostridium estertheticum]|uniref:hypothetical protein n=1 Tax=Clostridium estertheticum TaxID=238834 RepID=UPI001C0B0A8D|nr:hypothetical protein [Clostridium estertheticum]MBU3217434.1 hypothetical protein [Clostridium estertheticum]WAG56611.1 hypothetical protein LL033_05030 [Clostridium estertheticum]